MSQKRVTIYGDLIETADIPDMISRIMSSGRLVGNDFIVAANDLLQISVGSCLLPNGILIIEDEIKSLVVPNSSLPSDYTVIYQLEDTITLGGSPAILRLISGMKKQEDYTDAVVLGWIRYVGGSIPLNASMFMQPSHLQVKLNASEFHYLNNCPLSIIPSATTAVWTTETVFLSNEACTRFINSDVIPSTYTFKLPFTIPSKGQPRKLITRLLVDSNCLVTYAINLKGNMISLSPNNGLISNTGDVITRELDIPLNTSLQWNSGTTAYIEVTIEAQPSRGTSIAYIGLTMEATPFLLF